jgi:hypothetical protein
MIGGLEFKEAIGELVQGLGDGFLVAELIGDEFFEFL